MRCYCCSDEPYENCCKPILEGHQRAKTPELLMRSRYSAYCVKDYRYILETYAKKARPGLSETLLAESAEGSQWFALNIDHSNTGANEVTFTAFYFLAGKPHQLHETSLFEQEDNEWVYATGTLHQDTGSVSIGRNDRCPCLSGKKFKQCCLKKVKPQPYL